MNIDGIYENVSRYSLPETRKEGAGSQQKSNRNSRIILAVLTVLVLILFAALLAMIILYLQAKTSLPISEAQMWKAQSEKANASIAALTSHNELLLQKLGEFYSVHMGNLYYFSCVAKTWVEAEKFCVSKGAHLTSVTSKEEQEFLYKRANGVRYWNGLNRREDGKTFHWTDGTLFDDAKTKDFWLEGEPNNDGNNENCVHFWKEQLKSWNDLNCANEHRFICKWNCEPSWLCNEMLRHRL